MKMNVTDKINRCKIMVIIAMVTKFPYALESKGLWYSIIGKAQYHWLTASLLTITLLWEYLSGLLKQKNASELTNDTWKEREKKEVKKSVRQGCWSPISTY